ncbi:hypothetical protein Ga0466249_003695 [Sporomusaceae bacterium BoRhaA]|uniref:hypothetical protein n=1 Tax=Pelorhabdus rhamnosifermentans TaxID=2772457 RepID=UPI001C06260B|nr:hypothetical protein [Pelorhabdus rhamnosifermentans]MBU2702561.1 hypothetical protein [Pelorhabdus rhamnosifermentans]
MGQWEKAKHYLARKMNILEQIAANTETQSRFIHKREMRGLGRVLGERENFLEELAMLNQQLTKDSTWKNIPMLAPMIQEITHKQQELLERSKQVLQEAVAERSLIAEELKINKIGQQVKNGYVNPWVSIAWGRFINERG